MEEKLIHHRRITPIKKRSSSCYQNKVDKITNWYNRLLIFREKEIINPNTKQPTKRKELKPLETYIEKIKKPMGENK
jgi:hypothetical protein